MRIVIALMAVALMASVASAELVRVECWGEVEYNQVNSGIYANVQSGDQVYAMFYVDSEDFIDSENYGVRSYPIILDTFELTIGDVGPTPLVIPQPNDETSYFNLRNDDPAADGFFIANNPEWPQGFPALDVPANIDPYFGFHWEVGYTGDTLDSDDILDAVGTYDYTGLTSYYTVLQDAFAEAMGWMYDHMVIATEEVAVQENTLTDVKALFQD